MTVLGLAILIVACGVCQFVAQRMAISRARSPKLWGLLAGLFGPLPLALLAVLPIRRDEHA